MTATSSRVLAALVISLVPIPGVMAHPLQTEQAKLLASDGVAGDGFGSRVSLNGDTVIVSSIHGPIGAPLGSAYVFVGSGSTWSEQAKVIAGDGAVGNGFGVGVSISGDTALIGADKDDDNGTEAGAAYVFVRNGTTWTQQAKLLATDGAPEDDFGTGVSVSGNTILVGADDDDDNGDWSGSAYVFVRSGSAWTQQAKLLPSDGAIGDYFGDQVSVDGDTALVGADGDDDNGSSSGSAYVFVRSGTIWTQQAKLLASDGAAQDNFGHRVSIDGNTAVISATYDDDNGTSSGSAYVFVRNGITWTQQAKLLPSDGASGHRFGESVSVSGDTVVVGTYRYADGAYIFVRGGTTWTQLAKLVPSDLTPGDRFGYGVSICGNSAVVGATRDDDNGTDSGSAYVFEASPGPGTGYCFGDLGSGLCPCANDNDGSVPGSGCANGVFASGARLTASGTPSVSGDTLILTATGQEPGNAGLYFQADNDLSPGLAWGDGLRCAGGDLRRLGVRFATPSGYSDTSGFAYTLSTKAGNVQAGDTKYYQCWYRNPLNSPCGLEFNTSNGYAITWLP